MTIDLALSEFEELWTQANCPIDEESVGSETLFKTPPSLGSGCHWEMQLDTEFTRLPTVGYANEPSPILPTNLDPPKIRLQTITNS